MPSELHKAIPPYKPKGKEEYMNARQLTHFRKMLEEMKRELAGHRSHRAHDAGRGDDLRRSQ